MQTRFGRRSNERMQTEHIGAGAIDSIRTILEQYDSKRVFLVAGAHAYDSSGANELLKPALAGREVCRFSDFTSNPKLEEVIAAVNALHAFAPDIVLSVGGGSTIDIAKSAAILSVQTDPFEAYIKGEKELSPGGPRVIAVPTTAGTGSETTHFAVVYIGSKKYSLTHPSMLPSYAIIDPVLLTSVAPALAAATGMDALSQAIESYWSVRSTDESKAYAGQAISLSKENLVAMVRERTDDVCLAMARGAHLSGKAINISKTTAPHALSYPLTALAGIPHGHAVALTLPAVIRFNAKVDEGSTADERGLAYVRSTLSDINGLLGAADAEDSARTIESLMDAVGLRRHLTTFGIAEGDISSFMKQVSLERLANNPRRMTEEDAMRILTDIL